ncbi:uncharacterized protein LOC141647599 [Silene latifolia]|uniref:uncharacterized protein LOC141647599 n=1 Tax=Silene latifolia TaxID=37657 RepID=UPI003D7806CF
MVCIVKRKIKKKRKMQSLRFVSRHNNVVHGFHSFQRLLLYSTSTATAITTTSNSTHCYADYLVESLGFSHKQALSVSTKFLKYNKVNQSHFLETANSVVNLFKKHGFDDTHLRKIVSKQPRLLSCNAESTLFPKFNFLQEQGFSESDIIRVISANPTILDFSVDSSILPAFQILRQVMGCHTYVITVLSKIGVRRICTIVKNLLPNVALLGSYGIPIEFIRKHLVRHPGHYMRIPQVFKDVTIRVEDKLGITRDSMAFLYGIDLMCELTEEGILSKYRIFESFGWTQSEIKTFVMKNPSCFAYSDERIKKRLDFLMNELQLEPAYLITQSSFFTCSLEKRILPRHKILLILKEKGLRNKVPSLSSAIQLSDTCFLTRFVLPFKEVHEVYAKQTGCSLKMLSQGSVVISS